jgi:hypothetical protein
MSEIVLALVELAIAYGIAFTLERWIHISETVRVFLFCVVFCVIVLAVQGVIERIESNRILKIINERAEQPEDSNVPPLFGEWLSEDEDDAAIRERAERLLRQHDD